MRFKLHYDKSCRKLLATIVHATSPIYCTYRGVHAVGDAAQSAALSYLMSAPPMFFSYAHTSSIPDARPTYDQQLNGGGNAHAYGGNLNTALD